MNLAFKAGALLAVLVAFRPVPVAAAPPLLGTVEFRAESLAALPQWQRALRQIEAERATYEACRSAGESCPSRGVLAWQGLIRSQR